MLLRLVAEKAFHGVNAHRFIEAGAIAGGFARVIADTAHQRGHRIIFSQLQPRAMIVTALSVKQPALDVFTRGTGMVAWRQPVHIHGPAGAPATGVIGETGAWVKGDSERFFHNGTLAV